MHFGTFQLTTEGIDEPVLGLEDARRARDVADWHFRMLGFGASMRIGNAEYDNSGNPERAKA
jgi:hypothetical protein